MKRVIAGGTGFIGQYLINKWLQTGVNITVVGRTAEKIKEIYGDNVTAVTWEQFAADGTHICQSAELVLNLVGANIGEKRWNDKRKQEILDSRINATRTICHALASLGDRSPALFNASAVGIYGLQEEAADGLPPAFDEYTSIDLTDHPDFLSLVGRTWEGKTNHAKAHGVRVINLRFGIVLSPNGGALEKISMPFKYYIGGPIGSGKQPFPWIHIADLQAAIEFLIANPNQTGPFNLVAPEGITQKQFATSLAKALNRPCLFPLPAFVVKTVFGEMGEELLLKGQHVKPTRLQELDFKFKYPNIDQALDNIYRMVKQK